MASQSTGSSSFSRPRPDYQKPPENRPPFKPRPCFYCGQLGHNWNTCVVKEKDVQAKRVIQDGPKLFYGDGTQIPRYPDGLIKDKVERYYQDKKQTNVYLLEPELGDAPELDGRGSKSTYTVQTQDPKDERISQLTRMLEERDMDLNILRERYGANQATGSVPTPQFTQKTTPVAQNEASTSMESLASQLKSLQESMNIWAHEQLVQTRSTTAKKESQSGF
ncbi:unnamed protein product [Cyclocybe aegerita]|uniref:CCHC-type domain-containing protein n=1 Tax=Cyclocybe aegerita TaxID=1973307 RepID=A0A8S0VQR2_CYCAE|nr:unnamed protein product [Cyclocybe aegerita]